MPGLRLVIRYVPDSSVSAVREIPVATFTAVIFAFGTSAPVLSVTVPANDPDCANTLGAQHTSAITTSQIALQFLIGRPLNFKHLDATNERAFATPQTYLSSPHPTGKCPSPVSAPRLSRIPLLEVLSRSFPLALENTTIVRPTRFFATLSRDFSSQRSRRSAVHVTIAQNGPRSGQTQARRLWLLICFLH